jgi:glutamyl-Q tRNA(Asp) synthetase
LHLGHAYSALLNFDLARQSGGRFLLRIEDIDGPRSRPEYEAAIYEDLAWLGMSWEMPVRRQSEHLDLYRQAVEQLVGRRLLYPAFESRAEIARMIGESSRKPVLDKPWPRDPDGAPLYPGSVTTLPPEERETRMRAGEPFVLRLDSGAACRQAGALVWEEEGLGPSGETGRIAARPEAWGDVVLARKETPTSYHLSVVIDDALQGVTHVVRGQDLFWATSVHRLLQQLLGLAAPVYRHHGLLRGEDGRKLSKSAQSPSLQALRAQGVSPQKIREMVGLP